jgi:hypothetical protein
MVKGSGNIIIIVWNSGKNTPLSQNSTFDYGTFGKIDRICQIV